MHGDEDDIESRWPPLLIAHVSEYAIFRLTGHGEVASWNPGARRIKGYAADETIGRHFSVFYTDDDRHTGAPDAALRAARERGQYDSEGWRIRKDGTKFWASVLITPLYAADGTFIGFGKIVRDTTDKRMAYEAGIGDQRWRTINGSPSPPTLPCTSAIRNTPGNGARMKTPMAC
ncbi:PAS domain S-box-containing protein [Paraburkholderia sp. UCT70]